MTLTESAGLTRIDTHGPQRTTGVWAVLVVRNERRRLAFSLAHHRALGVERFVIIDNGSDDGTLDCLVAEPDVLAYSTDAPYLQARLGIAWIEAVMSEHGGGRWFLVLDADELFVYPGCERLRLPDVCALLVRRGLDCLATQFIDMYADRPIAQTVLGDGGMLAACPYFDADGYYSCAAPGTQLPRIYGGPRARLFWPEVDLAGEGSTTPAPVEEAFDEVAYLARHSDVALAVRRGLFRSGLDHFRTHGHAEGREIALRQAAAWSEEAYLATHPDVAEAVGHGVLDSGLEHYVRFGQFESRRIADTGPPCLSQIPLLRWRRGMSLGVGRHGVQGTSWRRHDRVGGALLHFKLTADLASRSRETAAAPANPREPAWTQENRRYRDVLSAQPMLCAMTSESVEYEDSLQLLALGMTAPMSEL